LIINNQFVPKDIISFEQSGADFIVKVPNSEFTLPPSPIFTLVGKIK
jgi:hypothetical protein